MGAGAEQTLVCLPVPRREVMRQQELCNLLHEKRFLKALGLAISLDQPHTVLTVIKEVFNADVKGAH
ncbi:hypothetical protein CRUP_008833 [Coryphaenoides rupestris]|nr:hypothetical protein CRUP_008833 [Coryphaenoides rupestris]